MVFVAGKGAHFVLTLPISQKNEIESYPIDAGAK
jgi:hypothetical protein